MMGLEWSPDAVDDLDEIYDTIAEDDVDAADRMIDEIREVAAGFCVAPRAGIKIPELDNENFREFYHRMYTIVYEIKEESIRIHEVYHQKRIHIRSYKRG